MKVAVVIPSYNHENYIVQAIDSALVQTHPVDSIIIVDDGSKDNTIKILKDLYKKNSRVKIYSQENQNAYNALNRSIKIADELKCDVVSILNSDDYYKKDRLARLLPLLSDEISVVSSSYDVVDEKGKRYNHESEKIHWFNAAWEVYRNKSFSLSEKIGMCNFVTTTSNIVAKTKYLLANPFQPYHFSHDYFFIACAVMRGKMEILDEKLMSYRVHSKNTMNDDRKKLLSEMILLNAELSKEVYTEISENSEDIELKENFFHYLRGLWKNISGVHAGYFNLFIIRSLNHLSSNELRNDFVNFSENWIKNIDYFPNSASLAQLSESSQSSKSNEIRSEIENKFDSINSKMKEYKKYYNENKKSNVIKDRFLNSKWVAFNRFVFSYKKISQILSQNNFSYDEKLSHIKNLQIIKLGKLLGSKTSRDILKLK